MRRSALFLLVAATLFELFLSGTAYGQLAPTGAHYAGRASDTGYGGAAVNLSGRYSASIPLDLPTARAGLPIPLQIVYSGHGTGAAGLGWDIPLSYIQQRRTFAHRRPTYGQYVLPQPKQRTILSLFGQEAELVPQAGSWVVRAGTLELRARKSSGAWLVYDGSGRTYRFVQPPELANTGLWLLETIDAAGGARLRLTYQLATLPVSGGSGVGIDLVRIAYNTHPATGCAKHVIALTYGNSAAPPLAVSFIGEKPLARYRTVEWVDVMSRATCNTALQRLRRYELRYAPDADTQLPRLHTVRMFGRQGTLEEGVALPVASYQYGSATRNGKLRYNISQTIDLPPDSDARMISGSVAAPSVNAPGAGERYATWQSLTDITGDGRPDLILKKSDKLWVALNHPTVGGKTELGGTQGVGQLQDAVFQSGAFSTHGATTLRFGYVAQNDPATFIERLDGVYVTASHNVVDEWRQAIDVNGDGRLDIIDAAAEPKRWVIYLNTPGGSGISGVKWVRRTISVLNLALELTSRGHKLSGNRVPLARRNTSGAVKVSTCWRWNGSDWKWFNAWGDQCFGDPTRVLDRGPERTITEWQLTDINGDGYPDFVYDSMPILLKLKKPDPPVLGDPTVRYGDVWVPFEPAAGNALRAAYNVVGARMAVNETSPFARSANLEAPSPWLGVELWEALENTPDDESVQRQIAALRDVNGDGLADRVVSETGGAARAYLGVYIGTARAFSSVYLLLPSLLSEQVSNRVAQCKVDSKFRSWFRRGLRDLTGDGIPDFYFQASLRTGRVWIGTGAGFAPPVDVVSGVDFRFSHQTESCDGEWSNTDGGLFDIDGDGQPEVIGLISNHRYVVSQLEGSAGHRAPEAGRLIAVNNGYGATTCITYASAKDDMRSTHHVPFSEIVVSSVKTNGTLGFGGTLAGSRFAYGNAKLLFDPAIDAFVFPGYQREVEVRLIGGDPEEGFATVMDRWPLTPFSPALTEREHWLRTQRVGRMRDLFTLRASNTTDPWALLGVNVNDSRVIGVTHQEWDAKLFEIPPAIITRDCLEMVDPYDWNTSVLGNRLNACGAHGFVFGTLTDAYRGASPPPSIHNVQTRLRVLKVDDFGRATKTEYNGDRFQSDDDVCIETRYAIPANAYPRVLTAPASERVTDCTGRVTYASQSWRYDGLPPGLVSEGRTTSHFVQRRATDDGSLLRTIRRFDATHDNAGNVASVSTRRDGETRDVSFEYDPFGLVPTRTRVTASGAPPTESSTTLDPVSLEALVETDANNTQRGAEFDGFGRLVRSTVMPPGGQPGVRAALTYLGYEEGNQSGRRIVVKGFADPVPAATIASIPGRTTTICLDELGRERRTVVDLGSDYGNEVLVVDAREYDLLGRVAFEADAYPSSVNPVTPYGTTYHYKRDGEPDCFIRGYGRQGLTNVPDAATERFPTCFQRYFDNHFDILEVQDAASLQPGGAQSGVKQRIVTSAIGRPIEHSTLKGSTRLDYATFTHDRLGQLTSMTRYADPVGGADPVQWSLRMDSIGQILNQEEPAAAKRFYTYSDWGEMIEARWDDGVVDRRLVRRFDALGRLTAAEDRNDGVVDPETVNTYTYDVGVPSPHLNPTFVLGRLSRASAPTGEVALSYDAYGNVNARVFTDRSNRAYVQRTEYHADGRLATIDFELPDTNFKPERVKYAYDSADRLRAVSYADASGSRQLYHAELIDALGRVRKATHGSATYRADYTDAGRNLLTEAAIQSAQGARQFLFLGRDAVGREQVRREITNGAASGPELKVGYDALGRLSNALRTDGVTTLGSRQMTYNALGNVLALDDAVGSLDATLSYDSIDRDRICRIGYGNGGLGGTACNVVHDAVGNVVSQPTRNGTRQLAYFNSGAVRSIDQQGAHARLRYDPFGQVQELEVTGAGVQDTRHDLRFGDLIERRDVRAGGVTTSVILRHVPGPAGILVTRRGNRDDWIFEFGERRGNRVFTNEGGAFVQDVDYEPFGESTSSGADPGAPNYTSYQWNYGDALAAFGLSYLGARLYDPVIGRFLSRDPILIPRSASLTNPYAFAINDPVNASDPSGLQVEDPQPMIPILPFPLDFPVATPSSGTPAPAPDPWDVTIHKSGDPAIAASVGFRVLQLEITTKDKEAASKAFKDFVRKQIYTNQKSAPAFGSWCAAASRQMALKHAGIIQLGLSYGAIKTGLSSEASWGTPPVKWEQWHFNRTIKTEGGRALFSHPSKLHPDAIAQIARNESVGTGSHDRLRWMEITEDKARKFLDEGALVVVGTREHWLPVIHDPFSGEYVYLDPYADTRANPLLTSKSIEVVPIWGAVRSYHVLVHE